MENKERIEKYLAQTGRKNLTPAQRRRAAKKERSQGASDGKRK